MQQPTNAPVANASPASTGATGTATTTKTHVNGGRFDFDDGGTYCGGWEDGKAHGHGVCTGPKGQGAYSGSWHYGFEVSGVYTWPSGSAFEGQWQNGKRHGLGVETRGRWLYRGEWTQGFKGRYGVRQSATSNAKYEGTWANGLQDGYGSETYADSGTYQGQWLRGMRHGYGVRASAPFGLASHYRPNKNIRASLTSLRSNEGIAAGAEAAAERDRRMDDSRGGFVLKARSDEPPVRRRSLVEKSSGIKKSLLSGLKIRKQRSTGDLEKKGTSGGSIRSTGSSASWVSTESSHSGVTSGSIHTDSNASFVVEDEHMDGSVTETYMGEWKNDKRSGFGISERSDGLRYEGEWFANKKYGYGVTTFRDGQKEEGKYKNNVLITSQKKKHIFLIRSAKFRERIDAAVNAAQRASKIALQKADIAISRTATARGKAELADMAADHAREDYEVARATAKQFAPDFTQPGLEKLRSREYLRLRQAAEATANQEDNNPSKTPPVESNSTSAAPTINKQNSINNPSTQHYDISYQLPTKSYQQDQSNQSQQQLASNSYQNSIPQSPQFQQSQTYQQYHSQQPQTYQQQQYQPQTYQQQQYQTQQQQAYQPSQLQQQYQSNQSYPAQNLGEQVPQAMITPPTPLPETHKLSSDLPNTRTEIRRNSKVLTGDQQLPGYNFQQAMSDHFDHYKRPPSRDSSVDRYARATSRLAGSRQPSVDKTTVPVETNVEHIARGSSLVRGSTPVAGNGAAIGAGITSPYTVPSNPTSQPPFEEVIIRKRGLGQDIVPSPMQPKRTESLYVAPVKKEPIQGKVANKSVPVTSTLQRKKSLPDVQNFARPTEAMSREEVSVLSSARREELRRMNDEAEKLRANPLLYLVSPHVKDWFSRQQLVMLVLFVNISLAIMFFKLLT
uniref:Junctophilin n=1 Tax=Clastoptera arizonana TaxID=38151 RepID=A0A1B6C6A7_9HEMI